MGEPGEGTKNPRDVNFCTIVLRPRQQFFYFLFKILHEPYSIGEIIVSSNCGLANMITENTKIFKLDGKKFYRTGDVGQKDKNGLFHYVGKYQLHFLYK